MRSPRQTPTAWWLTLVISVALIWLSNDRGWWWTTAIIGLVMGVVGLGSLPRERRHGTSAEGYGWVVLCALLAGTGGWILPLVWNWFHEPVGGASSVIAGIMGFPATFGWAIFTLTGLIGLLLSVSACWLGTAIRRVISA